MATTLDFLDERTRASIDAMGANAREYQETLRRKRPLADVRRFGALAERGALVLDAGCGPASDLRLLTDVGLHPIGVDMAFGALKEARLLLPRHGLLLAPYHRLPFREGVFGGLWLSATFSFLPRADWPAAFGTLMRFLGTGPVYVACHRGTRDLEPVEDPVLGEIHRSEATEEEIGSMMTAHGLQDLQIEIRPDPLLDRKVPWVVALGRKV